MPTENERKFVLRRSLAHQINTLLSDSNTGLKGPARIQQGYLSSWSKGSIRVRSMSQERTLTAKQNTGKRVVEIETSISQIDFDDLFEQTVEKLEKDRYKLRVVRGGHFFIWEIDLFYSLETCYPNPYFILAEHEMPEGQLEPYFIPDLIQQYLLYAVPIQETGE